MRYIMKCHFLLPRIIIPFGYGLCIYIISTSFAYALDEFNILNLAASEKVNGVLLEILVTQPLQYDIVADQNQTVNINFFEGKLDTAFFNAQKVPDLMTWIKAYQFKNSAQLSFRIRRPFVSFTHLLIDHPPRIQVSLLQEIMPGDSVESASVDSLPDKKGMMNDPIDLIVIDPGHGGEDSGAVGKNGLLEKEITLDIANRLSQLLKKDRELEVILTRDKDVLIPLEERAEIANQKQADIFISIHANSSKKRSARGCETYFLSAAKNDEARAAAALENSSIRFERVENQSWNPEDLEFMLMDLVQSEFLLESSDLAGMIQNRLKNELSVPGRGINQAGFVVLSKAYMPAVLVETAFISNQKEEALLMQSSFLQKTALAIFGSIKEFKTKYESNK